MASKTREKLIDVARQLFARYGVDNTTMLDIAAASAKGRRTIYTYFKSKREIHQAVLDADCEKVVMRQRQILASKAPASEKLEKFLRVRYGLLLGPHADPWGYTPETRQAHAEAEQLQEEEGSFLPMLMRLDTRRERHRRALIAIKEMDILRAILAQGVESGEFDPDQARRLPSVALAMMKGIENPQGRMFLDSVGFSAPKMEADFIAFVLKALLTRPRPAANIEETQQQTDHNETT